MSGASIVKGKLVHVPFLNHTVVLVPREQLRFRSHGRRFQLPTHLRYLMESGPTIINPSTWDYSQGERYQFPLWWNNVYGSCYEEACLHGSQTFAYNSGAPLSIDKSAVLSCYLKLSGGDNGLSDDDIMPAWKTGLPCPSGPARILDEMTVNTRDTAACQLAAWACGGLIWTCALLNAWEDNIRPGAVWDGNGTLDPMAGHAMFINGRESGRWKVRTWGLSPAVLVTDSGVAAADSEFIVAISRDHFNMNGVCVFTGMTWEQKRKWWQAMGGRDIGPSPFPASPTTTTTPRPVTTSPPSTSAPPTTLPPAPPPVGRDMLGWGIAFGRTGPWSNGMNPGSKASGTFTIQIQAVGDAIPSEVELYAAVHPVGSKLTDFFHKYWPLIAPYFYEYGPRLLETIAFDLVSGKSELQILADLYRVVTGH